MYKQVERAEEAQPENGTRVFTTKPGVNDFIIGGTEGSINSNKTPMVKVLFVQKDGKSEFSHTFYLTEKAIPRLYSLCLDAGVTKEEFSKIGERGDLITEKFLNGQGLDPEEQEEHTNRCFEDINSLLKTKEVRLKVHGEIKDDRKNNRPEGYITPTLSFSGFSEPVSVNPTKLTYQPSDNVDKRTKSTQPVTANAEASGDALDFLNGSI